MIDDSDGDLVLLAIGGPIGLVLAIIFWIIAAGNASDCSKQACPNPGETAKLLDHECVCVATPVKR